MLTRPLLHRTLSPRINTSRNPPWRGVQPFSTCPCSFLGFIFDMRYRRARLDQNRELWGQAGAARPALRSFAAELVHPGPITAATRVHSAWVLFLIKMEVYELTSCSKDMLGLWFISVLNNKKEKGNVCYKSQCTQGCFSLTPSQHSIFFLALLGICFSLLSS